MKLVHKALEDHQGKLDQLVKEDRLDSQEKQEIKEGKAMLVRQDQLGQLGHQDLQDPWDQVVHKDKVVKEVKLDSRAQQVIKETKVQKEQLEELEVLVILALRDHQDQPVQLDQQAKEGKREVLVKLGPEDKLGNLE